MKQKNATLPILFIFGMRVLLILFSILLAFNLDKFENNSEMMSIRITLDLVITVPLIYLALIRKKKISNLTIMPFFVAGLIIASLVIPNANQHTLELIKAWLLPVVEITVISIIIIKVRKVRKAFRLNKEEGFDFLSALKKSVQTIIPEKAAFALSSEIGLFYYGFFRWKKRIYTENQFTYHKDSGIQGILGAILFVALIELFSVHLLIQENYPVLSWVLTIISAYGVIQIFGLIKSIPRTPHFLDNEYLVLRMGIFQEARIPPLAIYATELTTDNYPKKDKSYRKITIFDHNCIIHLKDEGTLNGMFGTKKKFKHLILSVDDKREFQMKIMDQIQIIPTNEI
ncbi:MAG: hypothetical protein P8I55_02570 [Crocinitomix sp.]|nr:hypothetical protein [Crocinitomix sp.]